MAFVGARAPFDDDCFATALRGPCADCVLTRGGGGVLTRGGGGGVCSGCGGSAVGGSVWRERARGVSSP